MFYLVSYFFSVTPVHNPSLLLNLKILERSTQSTSWLEMKSEYLLSQVSVLAANSKMTSDSFILLNQTLIPDIVSLITLENFEKQCVTIPWKSRHFPLVIIIYRGERKFVWFLDSTQEEQNIKCYSDWETRTWNLSSVNKVIWRTIYLLKMCVLLCYKFAAGK